MSRFSETSLRRIAYTACCLVVGCASLGCAPALQARADASDRAECDATRMDHIEREARRTFKEVHWLRCPHAAAPAL